MDEKLIEDDDYSNIKNNSQEKKDSDNDNEEKNIKNEVINEYIDSNKNLEEIAINKKKQKYCVIIMFIYEIFISLFILINSFISFSFLNIIHIIYSYFSIYNMYTTRFNFLITFEKFFSIAVSVLDSLYVIIRAILQLYMDSKKVEGNYDNEVFIYFNIYKNDWRTLYDYFMNSFIVIMIVIKLIFKNYNQKYFNDNELPENEKSIEKYIKNNSNILLIGIIILSFGSSFCPSIINLLILFFGFIYFCCRIFNRKMYKFSKKYLKYFFMLIPILSTLYNYILSLGIISEKLFKDNQIPFYYGITKLYEYNNKKISYNVPAIFNFIFFLISFFFVNLHTKCINYMNSDNYDRFNSVMTIDNDLELDKIKNLENDENNYKEMANLSLNETYIGNKEQIEMQSLFNFDMDCGIILFLKKSKNQNFCSVIKLFLLNFCYSTGFSLHACRISFIFWINFFRVYYESYLIIIWLLFSIKFSETKIFFYFTKFIIYPFFLAVFFIYYVVNIIDKKIDAINVEPDQSTTKRVINCLIRIATIFLIQMFVNLYSIQIKNLEDKEIQSIINKHQRKIEKRIINEFQGKYVVKPIEIFFRLYFILIDILIIIFFYLSLSQKINFFNEIVLVSIIFFVIKGKRFKKYSYTFLIILTISFLIKYTIYLFELSKKSTTFKDYANIIINDDLYKIYFYWISYYLLFLEYIGQNSKLFNLYVAKNFSIYEIIEFNLSNFTYLKFILNTLFNFIFGVYIWLLIPCFISCLLVFDNNFLSLFELTIVFMIYYKYIRIVNMKFKSLQNIYIYTRILIFTNILYLIIQYIIQFLNNSDFLIRIYLLYPNQKIIKFMELIGFFLFNSNYQKNLLSNFMMFILSIALHLEILRQYKLNKKDSKQTPDIEKYPLINKINNLSKAKKNSDSSTLSDINLKYINIKNEESEKLKKEKLEQRVKEYKKKKKIVQKIFNLLYYILHYYWIIIFIFEVALAIHWMLSISMAIQLGIFSFYMAKSFNEYYKCLKIQDVKDYRGIKKYTKHTLNQKLKLYKTEQKHHFKITSKIQHSYFSLIWIFTFSFIVLSYLTSIIKKILSLIEKNENINNYISAFTYFFGVYSESKNEIDGYGFWSYTWGYFITIGFFSVRAYLLSKFNELKIMYFNDSEKKINELESKDILSQNKIELNKKVNKMNEEILNDSKDINFDVNINNNFIQEEGEINKNIDENDNDENESDYKNIDKNEFNIFKKEEELNDKLNKKYIENYYKDISIKNINFFKENKNYYKDDYNIEYNKNIANKKIESKVSFQLSIKRFIEIILIVLIFINALIKCNVLSFIYLLIMIPAFKLTLINTFFMFKVSFIALFLTILQYIFFISNISYITNPFIKKEIVLKINQIFHLPWLNDYRWSTFLSLGTNRYHLITIWLDVVIILILYFYIEFFSFTIFIEGKKEFNLKIISKKYYNKYSSLKSISKDEFKSFIRAMKVSYNIELIPSFETEKDKRINEYLYKPYNRTTLKLLNLFKDDKRIFRIKDKSKKSVLYKIRDFLYISFQYLFLLTILLISSFNQGIIGFGYMAFSIFYIYKSNCFLKGRRWTLLNGIKYFMKPYLFFDILTQFIFQIPLNKFKKNETTLDKFFKLFGYIKIADYSSKKNFISGVSCFIVILKILSGFLLLIQENMYDSFEFKKFILKYHYLYMQKTFIKGKLHSFLFNNQRISLMKDRNNENNKVEKNLLNIEKTVNIWNKNLKRYNYEDLYNADNIYNITDEQTNNDKKQKGTSISKILREHWLISITLKIFADSNYIDDNHYNISGYILRILKGNYILYSYLENLISDYEKKNYMKYNNPKKIKKILEEYYLSKKKKVAKEPEKENYIEPNKIIKKERTQSMSLPMLSQNKMRHRRISEETSIDNREIYEALYKIQNENNKNIIQENIEDNNSNSSESSEENKIESENHESTEYLNNYIRFENHLDDMFFANSDYRDLQNIIRNNFFNECCSRKRIFLILLQSIWHYIIEHNEYSLYFFILLYHLFNGKLLSLIYPILILIFGIIQYPRPSKVFWKIIMVYTTFVIFLKFLIQLNFWDLDDELKKINKYFDESSKDYIYYIGLKKIENHNFLKFLGFIFPDFFILILLIINQILLTRKGLWYNIETDYENIEEANYRIMLYNSDRMKKKIKFNENSPEILTSNEILKLIGKARAEKPLNILKRLKNFFRKIFNKLRNEKPGMDYYSYYTFMQIVILIYIIFFYTKLEQDSIIYNANVFKLKQFSGNMVIFAFIHVFLLTFDRFLYLRNTGKLNTIAFKVFNKKMGEDITYKFKKYKYDDIQRYIESKNKEDNSYEISEYQIEDMKIALIIKFITQIILVVFIHLFIYFYLPSKIRVNPDEESEKIINDKKNITHNAYVSIFYLLYILYFFFSGLQIKYGYTDVKKISSHIRSANTIHFIRYKIYMNIPFLYELKNFIDWTFTSTALSLWQWLKLEETLSLIYLNKCYSTSKMSRRVGTLTKIYNKIIFGGLTNLIVIALIFGPLILFSSLNPINSVNQVNGINLKIILSMNVDQSARINLTLFQTDNSIIQEFKNESDYSNYLFKQNNVELNNYNKSYKYNQVQKVNLISFSEYKWDISNQFKKYFSPDRDYSKGEYYLSLKYSFTTSQNNEITNNYRHDDKYVINEKIMNKLSLAINSNVTIKTDLFLQNFYYPYQRITEDNAPNPIVKNTKRNVTLSLEKSDIKNHSCNYNWYLKEANDTNQKEYIEGIEFLTFTDLFSSVLFGYDVITFYITFIFVSGKIIRAIFLKQAERVIYTEMVNQKKLFSVCEGIKISRMRKNFLQEKKLYYLLIEMMRSPEIIKKMTQSSLIYIQKDNLVKEETYSGVIEVDSAPLIRKHINKRYI